MEYPIYKKLREKFNGSNAMFLNKATCAAIADFMSTFIELKYNELLTQDATEYLMSSKLNMERINSSIKDFEKNAENYTEEVLNTSNSCNIEGMEAEFPKKEVVEQLEKVKQEDKITPLKLLTIGFEEVYQKPEIGDFYMAPGFLYYSLDIAGIPLLSTSIDEPDFYVYLEDNTKITSIKALSNLVTSLREL